MARGTEFAQEYQQAEKAYMQGRYEEAAEIVDRLVVDYPQDPSARLLKGHIYCYGLQRYDVAQDEYQSVLGVTSDPEFVDYANTGLNYARQCAAESNGAAGDAEPDTGSLKTYEYEVSGWQETSASTGGDDFVLADMDFDLDEDSAPLRQEESATSFQANPFDFQPNSLDQVVLDTADPFASNPFGGEVANASANGFSLDEPQGTLDDFEIAEPADYPLMDEPLPDAFREFDQVFSEDEETGNAGVPSQNEQEGNRSPSAFMTGGTSDFGMPFTNPSYSVTEDADEATLFMGNSTSLSGGDAPVRSFDVGGREPGKTAETMEISDFSSGPKFDNSATAFKSTSNPASGGVDFLDDFEDFDDLGNLADFDMSEDSAGFTSPSMGSSFAMSGAGIATGMPGGSSFGETSSLRDDELFNFSSTSEQLPSFTQLEPQNVEVAPTVEQGWLAPLENAPLQAKQWVVALAAGAASALAVGVVSFAVASSSGVTTNQDAAAQQANREVVSRLTGTGWLMALAGFVVGGGTAYAVGQLNAKQMQRSINDLRTQFDAVCNGNLNARASVYSEDEIGQLSAGFNQMARVILTTTSEAQRKAEEQEQAKEDLQRQVIRLLDDVEGAARGDLTVQAEVTADVLGAVADSFNLTIQNLREIVQQVKLAARQVSKGSTENEMFARGLSSDALRQAEELAVTLNSVQMMTDSIQRVAESAREAESVAQQASATALKGGEAVERTVSGILEIRETVAETTRKVKRLAESSQEISKIVALISQIASRTNLLALNASIEAARAGEAGRGFAIVADEVRQLADRAAKASKEIEQIVLQIQSETGSVMTAMEEGTQQVIEGTRLAEQAKRSLDDIIQVSNRINTLVQSITADTVEQTETSRAVAQVMQSVELTAQETSQEAQRVSASLQNLVGVARDLLTSVERFRVETVDRS
ncbi:methyl-accepting chemotaxis protein [Alkalinema sp. FACHB-956]|uniref:methyl-accepting chemotaxis protein n=1 Tax=Alkalinema sp. FACHB-956 TaxID=2692768 RepID=UPI0016875EFD|nr:methyl-accepting chemotaxis protein [Alkalinema sp. FACHB-956]MBD2329600.1 HAMP domain-containing protein [Alkalinema sp. FACHB-956]